MAAYQEHATLPHCDLRVHDAAGDARAAAAGMQHLLGAIHGNQAAMDAFVSVTAGTMEPAEFFANAASAQATAP